MNIIWIIILSILSGIFYRLGGSAHGKRWIRPVGVSLTTVCSLVLLGHIHWSLILCFGLMYASLTTYWDFINKCFKKNDDEYWWNWGMHGFFCAASILPLMFFHNLWHAYFIRIVLVTLLTILWSEFNDNAVHEEFGRGVILNISTLLFLIQ